MKVLLIVSALIAQTQKLDDRGVNPAPEKQRAEKFERIQQNADTMMQNVQRLGPWDEHYGYMMDAMRKVFDRYGWTSEPDQFALNAMAEVEAIPPMQFQERFEKFNEIVRERYSLDEDQLTALRSIVFREAVGIFSRNSDRIVQYASEALSARANREAITPEQVARWVELARPVMDDARERMNNGAKEFAEQLRPEQREVLKRDLDAANHRVERFEELSHDWAAGKWSAGDWGLEDDPIQVAGTAARAKGATSGDERSEKSAARDTQAPRTDEPDEPSTVRRPREPSAEPVDPVEPSASERADEPPPPEITIDDPMKRDTKAARSARDADDEWARYVRGFIKRYALDEAQQNRAWSIYTEASQRGDRIRAKMGKRPATERSGAEKESSATKPSGAVTDPAKATDSQRQLDQIFDNLKRRLDRLPTRAQRTAAGPEQTKSPDVSPRTENRKPGPPKP